MSAWKLLIISALAGCLRIYPDPELPDVEVVWFDGDCMSASATTVALTLTGIDDPSQRFDATVACVDQKATFADVARIRFHVTATLRDAAGHNLGTSDLDTDLRDGLDKTTDLFFNIFGPNFSVAWAFEDDTTTCASLAADTVSIRFTPNDGTAPLVNEQPCEALLFYGFAPLGTVTVSVRALAAGAVVAESAESAPLVVAENSFTDAGTLVLVPSP